MSTTSLLRSKEVKRKEQKERMHARFYPGAPPYFGKICEKHPQLKGRRYRNSCIACRESSRSQTDEAKQRRRAAKRDWYLKRKETLFKAYGGVKCVRCGETDIDVLVLDHIDGGGNKHRSEIGYSNLYKVVIDAGYPSGYRVLCFNCNHKVHIIKVRENWT